MPDEGTTDREGSMVQVLLAAMNNQFQTMHASVGSMTAMVNTLIGRMTEQDRLNGTFVSRGELADSLRETVRPVQEGVDGLREEVGQLRGAMLPRQEAMSRAETVALLQSQVLPLEQRITAGSADRAALSQAHAAHAAQIQQVGDRVADLALKITQRERDQAERKLETGRDRLIHFLTQQAVPILISAVLLVLYALNNMHALPVGH